ncbi:NAD(P)-binding protein [Schizopora paradoxa]|uniref:NAD(P)-binding protein n=1 Tax=Schizopora paradoxa TaxID=27342 RepID=A0A0H2S3L8_9AGAM|nr:NAD(P)-binding protein [Schizopora paradoxa]
MATLAGKTIVVVGGSSGLGFGVAKASLLSSAAHVVIASSNKERVEEAVVRLQTAVSEAATSTHLPVVGKITGEVLDVRSIPAVHELFGKIGEIDHLVWTSGDPLRLSFPDVDLDSQKDIFDVRFWGAVAAAQKVKIRPGGSITLSIGSVFVKPRPTWSLVAGITGAVDALTRGLAVDLAPVRVNVVCPGLVKTELWDNSGVPKEAQEKMFNDAANRLLVKHVADADEIAEAYLFCMKCQYLTGQRIEVDGGSKYI